VLEKTLIVENVVPEASWARMRWLHIAFHLPTQGKIAVPRWRGYVKFPSGARRPK